MVLTRVFSAGVYVCLLAFLPMLSIADSRIDPALPKFIEQVWAESPMMQGAQAELDAAQARTEGANRPLHNPSLEFDTQSTNINTSSIGLNQTLDWSDKQAARIEIAKQEQQAAQAAFKEARRNTSLETLNALAAFFTASELRGLAKHRTELMREFVYTAKQRQAAGDVTALDVTLAQVVYSQALMFQATAESILAEAEAGLQAVSGLTQMQWPALPLNFDASPSKLKTDLFEKLPNLVMLRSRMGAAKARIGLAKKEGRIDPTLGIRAGTEDNETLLGLSLEIPLFVRNNFAAEARAASHQAVAEEQIYRNAYRRAKAQLVGAFARHQNTNRAWRAWLAEGQQAQQEQMSLLDQLWQAGELSVTDYLIQAKQNIDTQEAAASLLGETQRAHFAWLAASNQVENWLGLVTRDVETNSGELK